MNKGFGITIGRRIRTRQSDDASASCSGSSQLDGTEPRICHYLPLRSGAPRGARLPWRRPRSEAQRRSVRPAAAMRSTHREMRCSATVQAAHCEIRAKTLILQYLSHDGSPGPRRASPPCGPPPPHLRQRQNPCRSDRRTVYRSWVNSPSAGRQDHWAARTGADRRLVRSGQSDGNDRRAVPSISIPRLLVRSGSADVPAARLRKPKAGRSRRSIERSTPEHSSRSIRFACRRSSDTRRVRGITHRAVLIPWNDPVWKLDFKGDGDGSG
jgi:hypothetical protein